MSTASIVRPTRRPRFRRAPEPPAFRLTEDDIEIIRQIARHRVIRSNHVAILVGRSQDRINDRLLRLFHAGYVDRPRAQLDYYPTAGSAPMIYALADRGARLLGERGETAESNAGWSEKNRRAGRPFIEHQIEIVNFQVALEQAARKLGGVHILRRHELVASTMRSPHASTNAFGLRSRVSEGGRTYESSVVPDLTFGLELQDGTRRHFLVEIDRGTMPVRRSDQSKTSFESKMRTYLAAHASRQHARKFGWQSFRVLTVTTDHVRERSMRDALQDIRVPRSVGPSLFWFTTFKDLRVDNPLLHQWHGGDGGVYRPIERAPLLLTA